MILSPQDFAPQSLEHAIAFLRRYIGRGLTFVNTMKTVRENDFRVNQHLSIYYKGNKKFLKPATRAEI